MVRVLHIIGRMHRAGAETFIMNNYRAIDKSKVQFDFLVHTEKHMEYDYEIKSLGGKIYQVTKKRDNIFKNFRQIRKTVKDNNLKIVHRHTNNAYVFLDLLAAKAGGAKTLIAHSHNTQSSYNTIHKICRPFLNILATDRFACSNQAGKWVFNNKPFKVIRNGIKSDNFKFNKRVRLKIRKELNITDNFVIGHVGRFDKQKNHMFLLDVFKTIKELNKRAVLLLIGDGELRPDIEDKIKKDSLDKHVYMLGIRSDVPKIMQAMDVFLFPSLYEGFPVTLVEAQAAGLSCIVSDTISEDIKITDNIHPISLKADKSVWAKAVLNHEKQKREDMSGKIRKFGYNIQNTADYLQEFYLNQDEIKNIVFVISTLSSGGAQRVLTQLANYYNQCGIKVSIVLLSSDIKTYKTNKNIDIIPICNMYKKRGVIKDVFNRLFYLRKKIKEINPDIVISFLNTVNIYSLIALLGTKIPLVISERNDPVRDLENTLKRRLRDFLYPLADGVVFQTKQAEDYFCKKIRDKSVVIPNPVKADLPKPFKGVRENKIVAVGRLEEQKNYPLLLSAFKKFSIRYPEYKLEIYGEGSKKDYLKNMAKKLGISDKVSFKGVILNLHEEIKDACMYVMTSDYEGMPNALMEAMAIGLPCISSDCPCGGPKSLIKDGCNGFLFNTGDDKDLLNKMNILAENKNIRDEMGKKALHIKEQYDIGEIAKKWLVYIKRLQ